MFPDHDHTFLWFYKPPLTVASIINGRCVPSPGVSVALWHSLMNVSRTSTRLEESRETREWPKKKEKSGYHHWKQQWCDIDWCLGSLRDLLIKPINLYAEEVQIGPIRQDKTVLSGSYGNKSLPTAIGKAGEQAGDMTPWCSELGDYMLAAPLHLVLLRRPNCPAILSLLLSVVKAWWQRTLRYTVQLPPQLQL